MGKKKDHIDNPGRRDFLRGGLAASIGLAAGSFWRLPVARAGVDPVSRVVIVTDESVVEGQVIQTDVVRTMIDEGIKALTDTANPADAWLTLFPDLAADMNIGIKVNTINADYLPSHPEVAYPLAESLAETPVGSSNYPENRIAIWDRTDAELQSAGYTINTSTSGVRCFGTDHDGIGFHPDVLTVLSSSQQVSRGYTDHSDRLINLSVLKNAGICGVTFALKNQFGGISQPWDLHDDGCDPGIPAANAEVLTHFGERQNLCICDAIFGCTSGGPMGPVNLVYKGIVLSQDPVALDAVCRQILEDHGCTTGPLATYIETASGAPYNLGNSDLVDIEIVEVVDPTGIGSTGNTYRPNKITLGKNFPEPFNASTTIPLTLDRPADVRLDIYDSSGRRVSSLYRGSLLTGHHTFTWDGRTDAGREVTSGRYITRLSVNGRMHSRAMTLLK